MYLKIIPRLSVLHETEYYLDKHLFNQLESQTSRTLKNENQHSSHF